MNITDSVKAFFKAREVDPAAEAVRDAFSEASSACGAPFEIIMAYTLRATCRYAIIEAARARDEAAPGDPYAAEIYDEAVAGYTDPASFQQYTEAEIDAHTVAIENLTIAFDVLTEAFAAFNPTDNLYASAAALYKAHCNDYTFSVAAYSRAADCGIWTALTSNLTAALSAQKAIEDEFKADCLGWEAERNADAAMAAKALAARDMAAALKANAREDATKAKALEQKSRIAATQAEVFLDKARSGEALAEEALETNQ